MGNNIANVAQQQKTLAIETQNGTKQIQLYDEATGDMKNTYQILEQIAGYWDEMNNAQKQAIGIALAGKNQFEVFASVEEGFADAQKAVTLATDSENSALNENSKYMESISAKTNLAKAQLQELVLGDGGLTDFVKGLLTVTTALLKFANSGVGKTIINVTLLYTGITLLSKGMSTLGATVIPNLLLGMLKLYECFNLSATATEGFNLALEALGLNPVVIGITAIITLLGGLYFAYKKAEEALDDQKEALTEVQNSYDSEKERLTEIKKKLEEVDKERNRAKGQGDSNRLRELELEKASLETQLEIQKNITAELEEQAKKEAEKLATTQGKSVRYDSTFKGSTTERYGTMPDSLKAQISDIETLNKKIDEAIQKKNALEEAYGGRNAMSEHYRKQYDDLTESIEHYNSILTEVKSSASENAQSLMEVVKAGADADGEYQNLIDTFTKVSQQSKEVSDSQQGQKQSLEDVAELYGVSKEAILAYMEANDISSYEDSAQAILDNASAVEDAEKAYQNATKAISSMSDEFGTLNNAVSEYNSTGGLSLDTISDLLSLDNEYLSLLQLENGQMSVNTDMANSLVNAKINMAEATAVEKAQTELAQVQNNEYQSTLAQSATASSIAVESARQAGQAILESGQDADIAGEKWANAWSKISQGKVFKGSQKAQAKEIENSLKSQIVTLESLRKNIGRVTTATKSNTGSKKKNTDATKANTDALKKNLEVLKEHKQELDNQKKAYDDVISYIEDKLKTAIDNIENERDKILDNLKDDFDDLKDNIDKQKQELEDAKDADTEYWQAKIDALKEANDELESQIELQELLDSLERAKATKKMVYREGQGFVYEADSEAVSVAQKNLQEYYRKKAYEDELKQLQDYLKGLQDGYDKRIKDLDNFIKAEEERYKKEVEDTKKKYEDLIKPLQDYLDKFKKGVDAYENEQNRQKALFLTGIDFEKDGWKTRLKNLEGFLERYKALQAQITEATRQVTEAQKAYNEASSASSASGGSTGGGGGNYSGNSSPKNNYINNGQDLSIEQINYLINGAKGELKKPNATAKEIKSRVDIQYNAGKLTTSQRKQIYDVIDWYDAQRYARRDSRVANRHADGIYSTNDDEIAIVGDDPQFSELVVGSKLNSGAKILNSSKGTGVIPHNLTSTLVSMAQAFQGQQPLQTTNNSTATTISIGNINLPNVENGEQFVDYLQHFNLDMTNLAYSR